MIYNKLGDGDWTDAIDDWDKEFECGDVVLSDGYASFKTMVVVATVDPDHPLVAVTRRGVFWEQDDAESFANALDGDDDAE